MPMKVRANPYQFISGTSQEGASNLLAIEKGKEIPAAGSKGNLYILVEPLSRPVGADRVISEVLAIIRKTYFGARGPSTGALRMAFQSANDFLFQTNLDASPAAQIDLAVCCAVLRGDEALIARAGPCAAYHIHEARWQRLPAPDPDGVAGSAPLGLRKTPDIGFSAASLAPGDLLLLIESRGAAALAPAGVQASTDAITVAALRAASQKADFSALLIELGDGAMAPAPARSRRPAEPAKARAPELEPAAEAPTETPRPARTERAARGRPAMRWVFLLALLVPLLVAGIILGYNWYRDRQTELGFQRNFEAATAEYNTARTTTDSAVAKASLAKAESLLKDAQAVHPEDQAVVRLAKDILTLDDKLRQVTPVYWMAELYRFVNPNSAPRRLAVAGEDLYVLDAGNSVVTRHQLNAIGDGLERGKEITEVVRKGTPVGNVVVGNLIDLLWMPADGDWNQDALLILDASGHVIIYNPTAGLSAVTLGGTLKAPLVMGSFAGGRLYILDPGAGQIYRYTASGGGYADAPENYFAEGTSVDLLAARDMAIDGDIWVLLNDRIERYQQGQPVAFELKGLDKPFSSPAGIFTAADDGINPVKHLYISDTGNGRIVKIAKDGTFVRQFRPPEGKEFTEIHDLYVDEKGGRLYFVAGTSLYLADIPQAEQ